jgi:hypothetical protein
MVMQVPMEPHMCVPFKLLSHDRVMGYIVLRTQEPHCSTVQVGTLKTVHVSYLPCVGFQGYLRVSHYVGLDIRGRLERRNTTRIVREMSL